eukprot:2103267-Rhodomonas_salina.1
MTASLRCALISQPTSSHRRGDAQRAGNNANNHGYTAPALHQQQQQRRFTPPAPRTQQQQPEQQQQRFRTPLQQHPGHVTPQHHVPPTH